MWVERRGRGGRETSEKDPYTPSPPPKKINISRILWMTREGGKSSNNKTTTKKKSNKRRNLSTKILTREKENLWAQILGPRTLLSNHNSNSSHRPNLSLPRSPPLNNPHFPSKRLLSSATPRQAEAGAALKDPHNSINEIKPEIKELKGQREEGDWERGGGDEEEEGGSVRVTVWTLNLISRNGKMKTLLMMGGLVEKQHRHFFKNFFFTYPFLFYNILKYN